MKLYLEVTLDEYELPVRIADNAASLARMIGCSADSIYSSISKYEHGMRRSRFRKVEIKEDDD